MEENKISDLFASSLEGLRGIAETNQVTGDPIMTPSGTTIIPVSKMSLGFAGGGTGYSSDKHQSGQKKLDGGGGYSGATATPVGFLIVDPSGDVRFISVDDQGKGIQVSELAEKLPKLFAKIKEIFDKKKAGKTDMNSDEDQNAEKPETEDSAE